MKCIKTNRYEISYKETSKGGPGGYESIYLTSEADPVNEELYSLIEKMNGNFLPAGQKVLRQRNAATLIRSIKDEKNSGIASGFKPSGAYHFGHKLASSAVAFFQKNGFQIFMPVADLECMLDKKISKDQYMYWAADNLLDWGANGVDLDATHVYLQSEEHRVSNLAYLLARGISFDLALDTYGIEKLCGNPDKAEDNGEFPFLFAGITQVGDILLPQHNDFGNGHSFMVSGQDQDGHMKMTVELTKRALESGIYLPGISNIPSGLYIPHIRGIVGKASSSKPETTIYLGSGPQRLELEDRIENSVEKLKKASDNPDMRKNINLAALDMVRYIDFFNQINNVNFAEVLRDMPHSLKNQIEQESNGEVKSTLIDEYLLAECERVGQNNVTLVKDFLPEALQDHQRKRKIVLSYAAAKRDYKDPGAWSMEDRTLTRPPFWNVPEKAVVEESKRNSTRWEDLVLSMKDKLIP
jgi:tryptophanyl-tRNA synthetase